MTIPKLADAKGVKPSSVRKAIKRKNLGSFTNEEELPESVINQLMGKQPAAAKEPTRKKSPPPKKVELFKPAPIPALQSKTKWSWISLLPLLPLPMLGLAASYGVYFFAVQFVPLPVAIIECMAFELVYIGLGSIRNPSPERAKLIRRVSLAAVAVSVVYNTITAALHQSPDLLVNIHPAIMWVVSIIHGAPLAILGYYVNHLNFSNND